MKVNFQTPISFQSIPLYNVKLKKQNPDGSVSELPATFSKLSKNDKEDIKAVDKISYAWGNTRYGEKITSNFLGYGSAYNEDDEFYAIEGKDRFGRKIIYSIAEINPTERFVTYIQTNPKNKNSGVKGSGELMLYGLGKKLGPNYSGQYYGLHSSYSALGFYRQAGLYHDCDKFILDEENAPQFFERIEKKYNLDLKA